MEGLWGLGLGLIETGLALAIFFVLVRRGWPGEDDDCIARDDCHCERIRPGGIEQPLSFHTALQALIRFIRGASSVMRYSLTPSPPVNRKLTSSAPGFSSKSNCKKGQQSLS